MQIRLSHQLPL